MEIQQVVPTLGDTVYDDYIHTCIFAECDSFDVILRGVVSAEGNHIVSPQVSIKIGRTIFWVYDGYFTPVSGHAIGQ